MSVEALTPGTGGVDPLIPKISLAMQVAGTVGSTMAAYNKSSADKSAYEYQAAVQRNNAQLSELQARDALTRGQRSEVNARLKQGQLAGTQRASMAARGIDLGEGSPLNILTDTEVMGNSDALTIKDNANREAWGYRQRANSDTANADLLDMRANSESPGASAFGTMLTGAGSVASSWYQLSKATGKK